MSESIEELDSWEDTAAASPSDSEEDSLCNAERLYLLPPDVDGGITGSVGCCCPAGSPEVGLYRRYMDGVSTAGAGELVAWPGVIEDLGGGCECDEGPAGRKPGGSCPPGSAIGCAAGGWLLGG